MVFRTLNSLAVSFLCAVAAVAQPFLVDFPAGAVLRGAVFDASGDAVYLSAYDLNEVWKVLAASGEILARADAGKGASALASDGAVLACVNRSAKTVSLIRLNDFSVIGEASVGSGADEITALPGGGFAVANGFSDSITLIDPGNPGAPVTINGVSSVPSGIAASESLLAVTTRSPAALLVYAGGSQTPNATVPLPDGPSKVASLPGDQFAVLTKQSVVVVDGGIGRIVAERAIVARDIASRGDRVLILGAASVDICDAALNPLSTVPVEGDSSSIAAGTNGFALLSPKYKAWSLCATLPAATGQTVAGATAPGNVPEPAPVEAAQLPALEDTNAAPVEPEPVVVAQAEPAVETPEPEIVETAPAEPAAIEPTPEPIAATAEVESETEATAPEVSP
ncbi:MAG: hypothetical protein SGI88_03825, partial [Candidatus Hydrogenedentes bacterium]|nr:hypothetical protein [Candidatus Hydrogenedentota bacterium]